VVQQQLATPRYDLPVRSVQVTPDRRTLVLATAPHPQAAHYAIALPGLGRPEKPAAKELPQHPAIDLDYDLAGVTASWQPATGPGWEGWLPHLDLDVSRAFTAGSAEHGRLWERLQQPGRLTLRTQLDLWQMLRPAVQP